MMVSYYQDPKTKLIYNKTTGTLAPPKLLIYQKKKLSHLNNHPQLHHILPQQLLHPYHQILLGIMFKNQVEFVKD